MPPLAIAAGIGAAGSILGGAIKSSAASKAAKAQQNAATQQIAATQANQKYIAGLEQPTIDRGNAAGTQIGNFLNLPGTDPNAAASALASFRGNTGYQDLLNTGLGAVNSNAYARGLGASGATLKALQAKGSAIADQSAQGYLSNLFQLNNMGNQGISTVAGNATASTNAINGYTGNAADARSNGALASGNAWGGAVQNLANIGGAFAGGGLSSSYGQMPAASIGNQPSYSGVGIGGTLPNGLINFRGF